jgi:hypothetical protein
MGAAGTVVLLLLMLPLAAALVLVMRTGLLALAAVAAVGMVVSPGVRAWLAPVHGGEP